MAMKMEVFEVKIGLSGHEDEGIGCLLVVRSPTVLVPSFGWFIKHSGVEDGKTISKVPLLSIVEIKSQFCRIKYIQIYSLQRKGCWHLAVGNNSQYIHFLHCGNDSHQKQTLRNSFPLANILRSSNDPNRLANKKIPVIAFWILLVNVPAIRYARWLAHGT